MARRIIPAIAATMIASQAAAFGSGERGSGEAHRYWIAPCGSAATPFSLAWDAKDKQLATVAWGRGGQVRIYPGVVVQKSDWFVVTAARSDQERILIAVFTPRGTKLDIIGLNPDGSVGEPIRCSAAEGHDSLGEDNGR